MTKLNSLEDKIKNKLTKYRVIATKPNTNMLADNNNLAHDTVEIVLIDTAKFTYKIIGLEKENTDLKQQIDSLHKNEIIYHKRLKDIKDGIIGVLKEYADDEGYILIENWNNKGMGYFSVEQITNEILSYKQDKIL